MNPAALRRAIAAELDGDLLPFWRRRAWDPARRRFVRAMSVDGVVDQEAPQGLILGARLLWTFAALYRRLGDEGDLDRARAAALDLERGLRDDAHGGYLFRVAQDGGVLDGSKKTYGQAFALYAWAEMHRATGERTAIDRARELFERIEHHAHDDRGGYIEARARDWSATADLRLSDKDMNAARSMNTHLHVLEAYTNLYRIWPEAVVATRLGELIGLFLDRIVDPDTRHLHHFFDRDWRVLSDSYTYGHDLEAAWLLCEAAKVLGDPALEDAVSRLAVEIAVAVLDEGLAADGGLAYEGRAGCMVDAHREWWCQAEAVVGFWQAYQLTGDSRFAEAAAAVWAYVEERVVDHEGGEWFWRVFADGSADRTEPKVSEWKGPYHNVRMCLEMMERIER